MRAPAITSPCPIRGLELGGTGALRRCDVCRKDVHDLSAMAPCEAEAVLASVASPCMQYRVGRDGRVRFDVMRVGAVLAALAAPVHAAEPGRVAEVQRVDMTVSVVDTSGAPAGSVTLTLRTMDGAPLGQWTTAADGTLRLLDLPMGRYTWTVVAPERARVSVVDQEAGALTLEVKPEAPTDPAEEHERAERMLRGGSLLTVLERSVEEIEQKLAACGTIPTADRDYAADVVQAGREVIAAKDASMAADIVTFADGAVMTLAEHCPKEP